MSLLGRKTLYALDAVVDIAYNARPDPVQSKDIARRQGIPQRYLEAAMQKLVREGVLRGVRGPRGGYRLARERRRITVGEVVRLLTELEGADEDGEAGSGSELGQRVVYPRLRAAEEQMLRHLDTITIEDLCREAQAAGLAGAAERADFTI